MSVGMQLWACIVLPQLALDAVLRRVPDANAPLALIAGSAQQRCLHMLNTAAQHAGLRVGMRLTAAHALLPDFAMVEYDPQAQAHWQNFLAAWAYRHSSLVSAQWPGCIVMEMRASFRLLGPWAEIEARLRAELDALGFSHRIALAPTPRAALVLAGVRDGWALLQVDALAEQLDRVPVRQACLPDNVGERLQRMGIRDLRTLRALPRDSLRRRFGLPLLVHLDHLYGQIDDPLSYYTPPDHFDSRIDLGCEVKNHTALLFPLRRLIVDLCTYLSIRDGGVQRFLLRLEHDEGHTDMDVGLLAAERESALLFELTRQRLERVKISRPVLAVRLIARELPPFVPAARDLFEGRAQQSLPWPQLRERLRARLGDDAVYRVSPADDPRPERAWRRVDGVELRIGAAPARPPRPLWLLAQPEPLRDREPRIISGPERLESGWWDGEDVRRDYYVLETTQGQRVWAFVAAGERSGWMVHGWFA